MEFSNNPVKRFCSVINVDVISEHKNLYSSGKVFVNVFKVKHKKKRGEDTALWEALGLLEIFRPGVAPRDVEGSIGKKIL